MCMLFYLGCDYDAPCKPAWNEQAPAFHVRNVSADVLPRVRTQLPHAHLRYLGSRESCGCGFRSEYILTSMDRDAARLLAEAADHAALVAYLKPIPKWKRPMQILGCWAGDETEAVIYRRDCTISELASPEFAFREREIIALRTG